MSARPEDTRLADEAVQAIMQQVGDLIAGVIIIDHDGYTSAAGSLDRETWARHLRRVAAKFDTAIPDSIIVPRETGREAS